MGTDVSVRSLSLAPAQRLARIPVLLKPVEPDRWLSSNLAQIHTTEEEGPDARAMPLSLTVT